jgi:response regulator of citrate/malate metabolism
MNQSTTQSGKVETQLEAKPSAQPSRQHHRTRAFIIEDDVELSAILENVLYSIDPNIQIDWAASAEEAMARIKERVKKTRENPYDIIVADIFLEGKATGIDFWEMCREDMPETAIVITSALSMENFFRGLGTEAISPPFLQKPFTVGECRQLFEGLLSYSQHSH